MKICIINNLYAPYNRGGAEQVIARSIESLLDDGHEVILITSTPDKEEIQKKGKLTLYRLHPANLFFYTDAHKYGVIPKMVWHIRDIFHITIANKIGDILVSERPDIVHTHNMMGLSFLIPRTIRKLRFRHIHTVHDVQLVEPSAMILKKFEKSWRYTGFPTRFYTFILRMLMGSPHIVISPSQFLLEFYTSRKFFPASKCVLLRNPVPLSRVQNATTHTSPEPFRFLYVGQVEEHKGIAMLVQAYKELVAENNFSCELHIVGKGSILSSITQKYKDVPGLIFHGFITRDKLPGLYSMVDITVIPSLCYENSPTVLFESLSSAVPVLASHIEGIAELLYDKNFGITFDAMNKNDLIEKLKWSIESRAYINTLKEKLITMNIGLSEQEYRKELLTYYKK